MIKSLSVLFFCLSLYAGEADAVFKVKCVEVNVVEPRTGHGTAVLVGTHLFLTCYHCVLVGESHIVGQLYLETKAGRRVPASVIWGDSEMDLALLRTVDTDDFKGIVPLVPSDKLDESLTTWSYPLNSKMIVSGSSRITGLHYIKKYVKNSSGAVQLGSSGGAVTKDGKLVGLIEEIAGSVPGSSEYYGFLPCNRFPPGLMTRLNWTLPERKPDIPESK